MSNIDDRIWITSRIRMISERKALRNQNISYISVTYYSIFTVIISIFSEFYTETYPLLEQINLASSVIVLVASLVAGGFRFEATARAYRECYLKLQRLHGEGISKEEKEEKYNEILWGYENHSNKDYYDLIINHTYWEGKELSNGVNDLAPTAYMWISYILRRVFFYVSVLVLFSAPLVFLAVPLVTIGRGQ